MRKLTVFLAIAILIGLSAAAFAAEIGNSSVAPEKSYLLIDTGKLTTKVLGDFKRDRKMLNWCEIDDDLFISFKDGDMPRIPEHAVIKKQFFVTKNMVGPFLGIRRGTTSPLTEHAADIDVFYASGAYTIFSAPPNVFNEISKGEGSNFKIERLDRNLRVAVNIRHISIPGVKYGETVSVDINRVLDRIRVFEGFKTRHSYADGYLAAANYAVEDFKKMGFEAKLVEYMDGGKKQYNVVAQMPAPAPPADQAGKADGFYVVGGHLDSMSPNAMTDAPGADDNASGSAGAMAVAEIISKFPFAHKVRFVLFAGEELGLRGSKAYVSQLRASGEISKVLGMVNLDMIGFDKKPPISSMWQTKQTFEPFYGNFLAVARDGGKLKITMSYNIWGSDHVSFINGGAPAILMIEDEYGANPNYHKVTDRIGTINPELAHEIVRIVAQGLVNVLSAAK